MFSPSLVWYLFVIVTIFSILPAALQIDEPEVLQYFVDIQRQDPFDPRLVPYFFDNGTRWQQITDITLSACNDRCGVKWSLFPALDTQKRIATWHIPLFILIGSMHFASLGIWNSVCVTIHLLGDPISTFESLLSKLNRLRKHRTRCAREMGDLPVDLQKAVAMMLAAYDEWDYNAMMQSGGGRRIGYTVLDVSGKDQEHNPDMLEVFKVWLGPHRQPSTTKQLYRRTACLRAASELSDCRSSGLAKTLMGVVTYITVISAAFVRIASGDHTNRTGHTIAMSMLYSWLIPTVLLCALVGGFITKRSTEDVLGRLHQKFEAIEKDEFLHRGDSKEAVPRISRFSRDELYSDVATYQSLEWSGANYTFRPRQSCWGRRTFVLSLIAHLPVICACLSAIFISYTTPTRGLGCRSVFQITFGLSWIVSAFVTERIRAWTGSAYHQWLYIRIKDTVIFLAQTITFIIMIFGWFNSCFCWSAWFSLYGKAHVMLTAQLLIESLAANTWLRLVLASILGQLVVVMFIWIYFRQGVHLFHVSDSDRLTVRWDMPPPHSSCPNDYPLSHELKPIARTQMSLGMSSRRPS